MSWDALGASQPSPESNSWFLSLFFSLLLHRSFNQQHQVGSAAKKGLVISDSYHHVGVPKAKAMKQKHEKLQSHCGLYSEPIRDETPKHAMQRGSSMMPGRTSQRLISFECSPVD